MPEIAPDLRKRFLHELTILSNRFGISINGCGCCGSPWLSATNKNGHYNCDEIDLDFLTWSDINGSGKK